MALNFLNNGYFAGKVGIGIENPGASLEIGNLIADAAGLKISSPGSEVNVDFSFIIGDTSLSLHPKNLVIKGSSGSSDIAFSPSSSYPALMVLDGSAGKVGIGTTTPGAKLDVAGDIRLNSIGQELQFSNHSVGAYRDGSNRLMISGYGGIRFQAEAVGGMENQATRMVINPSGNVGIGTTSPSDKLQVSGVISATTNDTAYSQGYFAKLSSDYGTNALRLTSKTGDVFQATNFGRDIALLTGSPTSERMRITSSGNVGIGTDSPGAKLEVNGGEIRTTRENVSANYLSLSTTSAGSFIKNAGGTGKGLTLDNVSATSPYINFKLSSSEKMRILANGNVGIGTTSPLGNLQIGVGGGGTAALFSGFSGVSHGSLKMFAYGNTTPTIQLSANDSGTGGGTTYFNSGNVGIGTTSPGFKLEVVGNAKVSSNFYIGNVDAVTTATEVLVRQSDRVRGITPANLINASGGPYLPLSAGSSYPLTDTLYLPNTHGIQWTSGGSSSIKSTSDIINIRSYSGIELYSAVSTADIVFNNNQSGELMRVKGTGNVGIGTTSPGEKLEVEGNIKLSSIGTGNSANSYGMLFYGTTSSGTQTDQAKIHSSPWVSNSNGGNLQLYTSNASNAITERMRIDGVGNVGIGTISPAVPLQINGINTTSGQGEGLRVTRPAVPSQYISIDEADGSKHRIRAIGNKPFEIFSSASSYGINFSTNSTERMRISANGNVGIGTTSPAFPLHVNTSNDVVGYFKSTDNKATIIIADNDTTGYVSAENDRVSIGYGNGVSTSNITILNGSYNVGIGNTSPGAKLTVSENAAALVSSITNSSSSGSGVQITAANGTNNSLQIRNYAGGELMRVQGNGNVGIGTTLPGSKLTVEGNIELGTGGYIYGDTTTSYLRLNTAVGSLLGYSNAYIGLGPSFVYNIGGSEKFRIESSTGNVGIGTTSPDSKLDIEDSNPFVTIQGSSSSYANAGIQFITNHASSARALGAFYYNANTDVEWFSGLPYSDNDAFVINRNTSYTVPSSQSSPAGIGASAGTLFKINAAGSVLFNNYNLTNKIGTPTYLLGTDASGNIVKTLPQGSGTAGPYLPLAGGTMTGTTRHGDNVTSYWGDGNDLEIYHNSSGDSVIQNHVGDLYFTNKADNKDIVFRSDDGAGGFETYFYLDGSSTGTNNPMTVFPDNSKLGFGNAAVPDFLIYHDSNNSYIVDNGTGDLVVLTTRFYVKSTTGEAMFRATENGACDLFHNNIATLSTTSTGVTITGAATATTFLGNLTGIVTATSSLADGVTGTTQGDSDDSELIATTAFVQNLIETIPAGLVFQGTWNAATNTPTLTSGSGTTGNFYIVSVAGSTNLDGITDWKVGDWAVFIEQGASDQWEKIDNSSVLDGIGTGGSVAGWAGSGTSNTLTNSPITFSGSNVTIPGDTTVTNGQLTVTHDTNNVAKIIQTDTTMSNATYTFEVDSSSHSSNMSTAGAMAVDVYSGRALTIDGKGDIGIGTNAPATLLHVKGGADDNEALLYVENTHGAGGTQYPSAMFTNTNGNHSFGTVAEFRIQNGSGADRPSILFTNGITTNNWSVGQGVYSANDNFAIGFRTGHPGVVSAWADPKLVILTSGNVGIGTDSPSAPLEIAGDASATDTGITIKNGSATRLRLFHDDNVAASYLTSYRGVGAAQRLIIESGNDLNLSGGGGSAHMVIKTSGNVGIGTTSPGTNLDVAGDTPVIRLTDTRNLNVGDWDDVSLGRIEFKTSDTTTPGARVLSEIEAYSGANAASGPESQLRFKTSTNSDTSATTKMTIDAQGRVGIGTTSPSELLHLESTEPLIRLDDTNSGLHYIFGQDGDGFKFTTNNPTYGKYTFDSNVGIGVTGPQSKLQVAGGIQMADDTDTASATKVGTMRYRTGTEYVEVTGAEILTNPGFDTDTTWVKGTGWTIANGKASVDNASSTALSQPSFGVTTGKIYNVRIDVSNYTSGSLQPQFGASQVVASITANGEYNYTVTSTVTGGTFYLYGVGDCEFSVDNASVIEVEAEDASYADMCMQTGSSTYEWVNIVRNTY